MDLYRRQVHQGSPQVHQTHPDWFPDCVRPARRHDPPWRTECPGPL